MKFKTIALSAIAFGLCLQAPAQDLSAEEQAYLDALEEQLPGTLINNPIDISLETFGDDYKAKVVKAEIDGGAAYQVRVKSAKANAWDVSVTGPLTGNVSEGDTVTVAFWARAKRPDSATGKGHMQLRVQQNTEPYSGVLDETLEIGEDWQLYEVSSVSGYSFSADEIAIAFNIGDHRQTLEFGPFYVLNLGPAA
ncbi:MAG: carbohydrate binding domain-containing protein [Henriciella sp.]|uniref:carbohydrate binding domain-containing protein n=1 Tax=Henriciella sp. TaxID=1968823 RepID=UPI003C722464